MLDTSLETTLSEAARAVARVAAGRSLNAELERRGEPLAGAARGALVDLCYGTLRRYGWVQAVQRVLSRRAHTAGEIESLVWCALYALECGRYADYTVVDQAVRACAKLGRPAAKAYVNAVLRSWLRERPSHETRLKTRPEARYWHPAWWIERLRRAYPRDWQRVLEAGNTHPPMCLRVNRRRVAPEDYAVKLSAAGLTARRVGPTALLLESPVAVDALPGFAQGEVSVQDAGAQRAARYLGLESGQRLLDACAAPGGKTAHLLELADVDLTALDVDAARCSRIVSNLSRLGLHASVRSADCTRFEQWWDGRPFARILADVPCSGSGVVRRHPDIKWLRRQADIEAFAARQAALVRALWRALAPGGKLLYVTCSVFPEENEAVVAAFVEDTRDAARLALPDCEPAQLLPDSEHDGFYFALLEKRS